MAYFEWTRDLEVGHPEIDQQHKRLLLLADAVVEPSINSAEHEPDAAQLRALIEFAQEHFAFEEGLMRSAGYPEADQHARHHASLLEEFRTYCRKVKWGENTDLVGLVGAFLLLLAAGVWYAKNMSASGPDYIDIDAAVLSGDLPVHAYLGRGFEAYLHQELSTE